MKFYCMKCIKVGYNIIIIILMCLILKRLAVLTFCYNYSHKNIITIII